MNEENDMLNLIAYGKNVFNKTIVGRVYKYLKKHGIGTTDNIVIYLMRKLVNKGNGQVCDFSSNKVCRKALLGLMTTEIFNVDKDTWTLNKPKAKEYKQIKIRKYYNRTHKTSLKLPLSSKASKLFKKIKFLHRSLSEMKKNKETENLFIDPFCGMDESEGIIQAAGKVGKEKLLGMIEGYLLTTKYCILYVVGKIMNKNYQNSPFEIQDKLIRVYERLKSFEKIFSKPGEKDNN